MPYKRNYRKKSRYVSKYKKQYKPSIQYMSNPHKTLFGNRKYINLRYQGFLTLGLPTLSTAIDQIYSANSLFDPDVTGIGHQPRGFDELQALFNHWTVLSSKCTVTWVTAGSGPNRPAMFCMIKLGDESTNIVDVNEYMEDRNIKWKLQNPGGPTTQVSQYFNAKSFFTVTDPLDNDLLRGDAATSPAEQAFFHIGTANAISDAADTPTFAYQVVIDYKCVFFEPLQPAQS